MLIDEFKRLMFLYSFYDLKEMHTNDNVEIETITSSPNKINEDYVELLEFMFIKRVDDFQFQIYKQEKDSEFYLICFYISPTTNIIFNDGITFELKKLTEKILFSSMSTLLDTIVAKTNEFIKKNLLSKKDLKKLN